MMVNTLIDRWFYERKGLALGIAATGAGVSGAVFLPIITRVIKVYGWRSGYLFQAAIISIMLTAAILMIRNTPESIGAFFVLSILLLSVAGNHFLFAYLFAFAFGIAYVTLSIPMPYLIIELFGSKEFTEIYGVALIVSAIGSTIGSILTGFIYDNTGSYKEAWMLYIAISAVLVISIQIAYSMVKSEIMLKNNIKTEYE